LENITLVNVLYISPINNKNDFIIKILKDESTGKKYHEVIEEPEFEFYVTKDEFWLDLPVTTISKDKVRKVTCKYKNLLWSMAQEVGQEKFLKDCIANKRMYYAKQIHLDPNLHASDVDICDFYIKKHYEENPRTLKGVQPTKAYYDIEVDTYKYNKFPEPEDAPCPINAITLIDDISNTILVLLLIDTNNLELMKFYNNESSQNEFKKYIENKYDNNYKVKMEFFEDEIDLINLFWQAIHYLKPDYCIAHNDSFDLITMMNRIIKLGYNPKEIMCHPDIDENYLYYRTDTRNHQLSEKNNYFQYTGFSKFVDFMLMDAAKTKSVKRESYALTDIASDELGEEKLQFDDGETISNLAMLNYPKFVEYNIHDVMLLKLLEDKKRYINALDLTSFVAKTRYYKMEKKTIFLKTIGHIIAEMQGQILSNNRNQKYGLEDDSDDDDSSSFKGAFVSDPNLLNHTGLVLNGYKSNHVFGYSKDMDFEALYPSVIKTFNIDTSCQIGHVEIYDGNGTDISSEFIDDLISENYYEFGCKWFNLPTIDEIINEIEKDGGDIENG